MSTLAITILNTVFWVVLHFGFAGILTHLPETIQRRWFDHCRPRFRTGDGEMAFYRRIRLPYWKDRLPQFNSDFDKRHLRSQLSAAYLEEFIFITCRAEVIHVGIFLLGWLSLLSCLLCEEPLANLPLFAGIAAVLCVGNLPFAMVQRYNRCRLEKLLLILPENRQIIKTLNKES